MLSDTFLRTITLTNKLTLNTLEAKVTLSSKTEPIKKLQRCKALQLFIEWMWILLFDFDEVGIQNFNLAVVFSSVTDNSDSLAVSNALGCYQVLELLLGSTLF